MYEIEENSRLFGLIKRYNPNYEKKVKMIDNISGKIESESRAESRAMSEIDMKEFTSKFHSKNIDSRKNINLDNNNNINQIRPSFYNNNNDNKIQKNCCFVNKIISNCKASPIVQKMELNKQKKRIFNKSSNK